MYRDMHTTSGRFYLWSWTSHELQSKALTALLALIAHQIFRRHESYSIPVHLSLLFGPPLLLATFSSVPFSPTAFVSALASCFTTYILVLVLSVITYRLSPYHPLAGYPGPLTHRITKLWLAFVCIPGKQHEHIKRLHERYGDVVRIAPNELSIRDPSTIPIFMGPNGLRKGPHYIGRVLNSKTEIMIGVQDIDEHMHRRRPWARGLGPQAVRDYEERVAMRVKQLVTSLGKEEGVVQLNKWMDYFAFDFMSDMAFGGGSDLLQGDGQNNFWSMLTDAVCAETFVGHVPWLADYIALLPFAAAPLHSLVRHCAELTEKRIANGTIKKDLFHYLNHEDDEEAKTPPINVVVDDGILAMTAGADTVASTLSSVFCCLLTHPDAYAALQAEVDAFYPPADDDTEDVFLEERKRYHEMPYLTAVINEALRLFPPVPSCTQREAPADSAGMRAGSIHVPPGTTILMHCYSMHRDRANFSPAPDTFWPERWLVASGALALSDPAARRPSADPKAPFVHNEDAWIPFSAGPMVCVGRALAGEEMRAVVCALLRRFRIRALTKEEGWEGMVEYEREFKDYFITTRGRVPVRLEARKLA